ncbi:hypothetical protein RFI_01142 [Reticulomyxa filosa]|uniref:BTB domain-containing protein n=1 Tax=Reticulomyxa filosa TaxID=46433 RepID=X6PCV4_RETFI|nr:hypothetical protein RFI_01142 [Reticulomyxa filosa]|eukprot:ETO35918.1 hypothetical protein RFI_01142 [Reticulomyxa filosa]
MTKSLMKWCELLQLRELELRITGQYAQSRKQLREKHHRTVVTEVANDRGAKTSSAVESCSKSNEHEKERVNVCYDLNHPLILRWHSNQRLKANQFLNTSVLINSMTGCKVVCLPQESPMCSSAAETTAGSKVGNGHVLISKVIFAALSKYFESMFGKDWHESLVIFCGSFFLSFFYLLNDEVVLNGVHLEDFILMRDFLYTFDTDIFKHLSREACFKVIELAQFFLCKDLKSGAMNALGRFHMDKETLHLIWSFAHQTSNEELRILCCNYSQEHFCEIFSCCNSRKHLTKQMISEILKNGTLPVSTKYWIYIIYFNYKLFLLLTQNDAQAGLVALYVCCVFFFSVYVVAFTLFFKNFSRKQHSILGSVDKTYKFFG